MPPPGRAAARQRVATNENDENSGSTRTTRARAKAAAIGGDDLSAPAKGLQAKKTTGTSGPQAGLRKRAALGDVSNVTKVESVVEGKKAIGGKATAGSKTVAHPGGIQKKASTTNAPRTALVPKQLNKKVEPKLSGSGSGSLAPPQKRKALQPSSSNLKEESSQEGEPVRKKIHSAEPAKKAKAEPEYDEEDAGTLYVSEVPEVPEFVKLIEGDDEGDPLMVAEYANDIFEYLRDLETKSIPNPNYMAHQDDLEWKTRGILIDWLIEVHTRFHLLPETLFLAVNIIDRFLSEKVVQLDRLQLVGITAMFIASKYEEVLSPHVANFRHVADDGFSESEILSAERFLLSTLNYDLSYPNPMNFLRRISKADDYDIHTRTVGKYLMEISLLDHRFMEYRPSHVAASAMYLARVILERGDWDETLAYYAGYTEEEIEPVFRLMVDYLARPVVHEAFFKKYASKKFLKASIITRQWAKKHAVYYGVSDVELSLDQIS
ncbi:G2/M cyclins accumulate steadily during G2 and are abruptly destroyed at mitosis-like protein [Coniochaeta hoffmannii]|uniref:G2/M cyclins accumulate steadily during G2 and are abruptly destroyed at mitosis-like protein n=1 Tax=Coniochaeta hoffmannii TaxID=91930 RepID=A0AA38RNA6_9PEZI|nr:G2/M cyclins accumulate steadily during G2 and are abruptly destroyed at mitosis-like protein [Coniochaeta hoffmannii]